MYKKALLLLLLIAFAGYSQSPAQKIVDSLKLQLRQKLSPKEKAKIYGDLAWYFNMISMDSALAYAAKSIEMAKALKDDKMIGQALSDYGAILYTKGDFDKALDVLGQCYAIRKKLKDEEGIASVQFKIGNVYFKQFALQKAMDRYLKALRYYEKTQNAQVVGTLETNIAAVYNGLKNYPKALEYLRRSEKYLAETNQESELATTIVGIGNAYFFQKDTLRAFKEFERGAKLAQKTQNNPALSTAYNNLGLIYTYRKQPKIAIDYITKSLAIRQQINQTADVASSQLTLAINYGSLGQFPKAKQLLLESLKVFTKDSIREKMGNVYIQLIPVYASLGKVDSVTYYTDLYLKFADKNLNDNVLKISNELETKYQTEKKEKLLLKQEAETKRKSILLLLVSIFAIFIALIGYLIYRQQRLKNRQQEQEHALKLAISKIETQNKLQEQRLNISRDLHDNIGAQLTFIISSVDNIKYGFNVENPNLTSRLDRISNFTKSTIVELRDTIWAMNSEAITFKDLELRIMNFIENAKKAKENINFKFEIGDDLAKTELSSIVGMNVYRTIQEAVNNAIKYSEAEEISIRILGENNQIRIIVSDNGEGFDIANADSGNGLHNMKKRIKDIDGTFEIDSQTGKGTNVSVILNQ
jgi:signal transduction histidine kinase